MNKIFHIALRELWATVGTKGFILGILMTPLILLIMAVVFPMLINQKPPKIDGEVAIYDPTGAVVAGVDEYLLPEAIAERRGQLNKIIEEATPAPVRDLTAKSDVARQAMDAALGEIPKLRVLELSGPLDLEAEKSLLLEGSSEGGGRLAVLVVADDALKKADAAEKFGAYDFYVRENLDDRITREIRDGMRNSIVDARVGVAGMDRERIEDLTTVPRIRPTTVTAKGDAQINEEAQIFIPMGFMMLLLILVFTGGQYLMSTTMEEKSSRVVEVLLSAVSPMELMTGKIIGQLVVGLLIIGVYGALGISALSVLSFLGLLDFSLLIYLVIFYFIAYFIIGSFMAAIGAAVNEPREAQSFMMPIMMIMMIPWLLWLPISRDPNTVFATLASFTPPINSFCMLLRMTSSTPPPLWQVWLSILIGIGSVYAALWFAAKVFRVGLLLHGTPPNFRTLIKWVRMS